MHGRPRRNRESHDVAKPAPAARGLPALLPRSARPLRARPRSRSRVAACRRRLSHRPRVTSGANAPAIREPVSPADPIAPTRQRPASPPSVLSHRRPPRSRPKSVCLAVPEAPRSRRPQTASNPHRDETPRPPATEAHDGRPAPPPPVLRGPGDTVPGRGCRGRVPPTNESTSSARAQHPAGRPPRRSRVPSGAPVAPATPPARAHHQPPAGQRSSGAYSAASRSPQKPVTRCNFPSSPTSPVSIPARTIEPSGATNSQA